MVPRPKLGGDSIYTLCHGLPLAKAYSPNSVASACALTHYFQCLNTENCYLESITKQALIN